MPSAANYVSQYPGKQRPTRFLLGYPVIFDKNDFIENNNNFPLSLLTEYSFTNSNKNSTKFNEAYLLPNGLQNLINFNSNNQILVYKLEEWVSLAEIYILEETTELKEKQIELDLLKLFRELYFLYLLDLKITFSPILSDFLILYYQGLVYRHQVNEINKAAFELINISAVSIFNSVIETPNDLVEFEKASLATTYKTYLYRSYGIPDYIMPIWKKLLSIKELNGFYKEDSGFFIIFKTELLKLKYNRISPDRTISLLNLLDFFDFSLTKDTYLSMLKNCSKIPLIKYLEEKLKENNCLPTVSDDLIIKEENFLIYNKTFHFNFNLIKSHVDNHTYASECLIAIIAKSFKLEEPDCSRISWSKIDTDGQTLIILLIETLQKDKLDELSQKLINYFGAIFSPEFLDSAMVKTLSKHPGNAFNRTRHEDNKDILIKYTEIKKKFILKENLEKKLVSKTSTEKSKIKKI